MISKLPILVVLSIYFIYPNLAYAEEKAVKCTVTTRLIEAKRGKPKAAHGMEQEERDQLTALPLPYGRYQTLTQNKIETALGQKISFNLAEIKGKEYVVSVTPHSFSENKVHYTFEWKAPGDQSVVATRLGVENGRSVMLGTEVSQEGKKKGSRCLVVGVKVRCE